MKKIFLFALVISISIMANAQKTYDHSIGIKVPGGFSGIYKKFITENNNIEALLTAWNKGFRLTGLYEINFYTFNKVPELSWFAGPGAHIGFWKSQFKDSYGSSADIGIDGIIGLDYKFKNAPINVSADWQPSVTLVGNAGFTPAYGGIAVRYIF